MRDARLYPALARPGIGPRDAEPGWVHNLKNSGRAGTVDRPAVSAALDTRNAESRLNPLGAD